MKDDETKRKIIEGSKKLFQVYGFTRITIDEIAVNLKISKKTIYKYFKSKDDLIWGVVESIRIPLSQSITELIDSNKDFHETMAGIIQIFQSFPIHISPPMIQDIRNMPHIWEKLDKKRREIIQKSFGKLVERGQKDGDIRKDLDPKFLMNLLMHLISSMVTPQTMIEFNLTPPEFIQKLQSVLMIGLLTEKGRKKIGGTK